MYEMTAADLDSEMIVELPDRPLMHHSSKKVSIKIKIHTGNATANGGNGGTGGAGGSASNSNSGDVKVWADQTNKAEVEHSSYVTVTQSNSVTAYISQSATGGAGGSANGGAGGNANTGIQVG